MEPVTISITVKKIIGNNTIERTITVTLPPISAKVLNYHIKNLFNQIEAEEQRPKE